MMLEKALDQAMGELLSAFKGEAAGEETRAASPQLTLKGVEIHSMEELREHFDMAQVTAAFLDGSLEGWLKGLYYEQQAAQVADLPRMASRPVLQKLCGILGVNYADVAGLTEEEREALRKKMDRMLKIVQEPSALLRAYETATTQAELAQMLDEGFDTVCLCGGPFSVPIRKGGVHYIGLGDPKVDTPFTQEEYRRAGITFEGVRLPLESSATAKEMAAAAAKAYGYDDFGDHHGRLATLFHTAMKASKYTRCYTLSEARDKTAGESYPSKSKADQAARDFINSAYDLADRHFRPGSPECIAPPAARWYGDHLTGATAGLLADLKKAGADVDALTQLVTGAGEELRRRFEGELRDNADFYEMYDRDYFLGLYELMDLSDQYEMFDSEVVNSLLNLVAGKKEYMVTGTDEAKRVLREDVQSHAATFFDAAYQIYQDYCAEIENAAEEIGKDLSDDVLSGIGGSRPDQSAS